MQAKTTSPANPLCARCGEPHGLTMADLVEPDPSLPVYCAACESTVCLECGRMGTVSGGVVVCTDCKPPVIGEPSMIGETCACVWCGYTSTRGEHEWCSEEDGPRGWECANESSCRVRLDALEAS